MKNSVLIKYLDEFGDASTIHGIRELIKPGRLKIKFVWLLIFLFSVTMMSVQSIDSVVAYFNNRTMTSISSARIRGFPDIMLCPMIWTSAEKTNRYNISEDEFLAIIARLPGVDQLYSLSDVVTIDEAIKNAHLSNLDTHHKEEWFMKMVRSKGFPSLEELIESVAFRPDEFFGDALVALQPNYNLSVIFTLQGPCYVVAQESKPNGIDVFMNQMNIAIRRVPLFPSFFSEIRTVGLKLFVDQSDVSVAPLGGFVLSSSLDYAVQTELNDFERVSLNHDPCSEIAYGVCFLKCILKNIQCPCRYYLLNRMDYVSLRQSSKPEDYCIFRTTRNRSATICAWSGFDECNEECPDSCKSTTPKLYINSVGPTPENHSQMIRASLFNPSHKTVIKESLYSQQTDLFSSLGGILSLYCGASVLSLAQILYYFCCRPLFDSDIEHADNRTDNVVARPEPALLVSKF